MNIVPTFLATVRRSRHSRRNVRLMLQIVLLMFAVIALFAVIFHYLMLAEGHFHSPAASIYWVLETMTTLGYGDIVFTGDAGRLFAALVLLTGILLIFIIVPFTFIETVYASWVAARNEEMAPRRLARGISGHVIITSVDPVSFALIRKLEHYAYTYVLLVSKFDQALPLANQGYNVMVGELDKPETYKKAQIEIASMVAVTCQRDSINANVAMTIRRLAPEIPIVAIAQSATASQILKLAGATHVLQLTDSLSQFLARRVYGGKQRANVVASFDGLQIAEATVRDTKLVGLTIEATRLRTEAGVSVLGVWHRGEFTPGNPDTELTARSVLVLAGSTDHLQRFNALYPQPPVSGKPVVIIGGGRIGVATGQALEHAGIDYRIIERDPEACLADGHRVVGDATRLSVLMDAGIGDASTVIVTTHDDDINIYLTLYLRSIRPDLLIISRSMHERNLANLHRAGADFVMSHSTMGANYIFNRLKRSNIEMLAEGLDIFRLPVPPKLAGRKLADVGLRSRTGCILIAVQDESGMNINPDPHEPLPASGEIILLATVEQEASFLKAYPLASKPK